jgi:hypothetical protein
VLKGPYEKVHSYPQFSFHRTKGPYSVFNLHFPMLKVRTMFQEVKCCRIENPHSIYNLGIIVINVVNVELMH